MSSHRLIGIATPDAATKLLALPAFKARKVSAVEALGLAALLLPDAKPRIAWLQTRKAEMEGLLSFQKLLEATVGVAPLLPAAYGSERIDAPQALALLTTHGRAMGEALSETGGLVQFQIEARWDPQAALARLKAEGAFAGFDASDRKVFGAAIQARMEAERASLSDTFHGFLKAAGRDALRLPLADETMVLNAAVMIDRAGEAALDAAVARIDAAMPGLKIRYLGPLPAVSFASIAIQSPTEGALARARVVLGVTADAAPEAIKRAYRDGMRTAHPDHGGDAAGEAAAALASAH
ncbi:MAG: GvpL/GvpF family gas vesicle protein, partial [Alsobacter sp.]